MILWFGKKKKKKELEEAGKALEAQDALIAEGEAPTDTPSAPAEDSLEVAAPPGAETEVEAVADEAELPPPAEPDAPPSDLHSQATSPAWGGVEEHVVEIQRYNPPPFTGEVGGEAAQRGEVPSAEPEIVPEPDPIAETKKPGFFSRMASGLSRSSSRLAEGITSVFTKRKLDEETLEELEDLLIASDLGAGVAARVTAGLAKDRFDKEISDEEIKAALAEEITAVLKPREQVVDFADGPRPRIVLFVGVNGSGKTTTIGKIASKLTEQGAKALLVAGDTFRAAAIEQLTVWGERAGIPVLSKPTGADAAGLVYEAVERAQREGLDLVLVDTAGRLQNKSELMAELAKIIRVTQKLDPDAPHDVILVLDATVGQNALSQVEAFRHTAGVTGLVMTKLDGTAKGGVLVAIADKHDLPIHFVGVGEKAEDLQPFSAEAFARALVGAEA
ncbi:MAG: signal recognition particle-docking protein FtsY [Hyphomonadaceae bacterium]|nr:signal recognition particle-docking protein FtsY [Hyphomonadaceae bacterium]